MDLSEHRQQVEEILRMASYRNAVEHLRDILRRHLIRILGGKWESIRTDFGMYTIVCRAKSSKRILEKFDKFTQGGKSVSAQNFYQLMPDLVGAKLVVVDPGDLVKLAEQVRIRCEPPLFEIAPGFQPALVRRGKISMYDTEAFSRLDYPIREEGTGYCSVHFVYRAGAAFFDRLCHDEELNELRELDSLGVIPMDSWCVEIQVRTMMDEAWGEIDHFVRYEDPLLRQDPEVTEHFRALSAYLQAANHHVSLIRQTAKRKKGNSDGNGSESSTCYSR